MTEDNPNTADIAPKPQEPVATAPDAPKTDAPPWGEDFNAEKAWSLVQNLRADKEKLQQRPSLSDEQKNKLTEYDRLVEASQTELERAQVARDNEAKRSQSLADRLVRSEVGRLAQGFADPEDAAAFLDLSAYASGDGDVDSDAIKADLAALLTRKPHLGQAPTTPSRMKPNPAQGRSDSPQMSVQERISAARESGDMRAVMRLKASQAIHSENN